MSVNLLSSLVRLYEFCFSVKILLIFFFLIILDLVITFQNYRDIVFLEVTVIKSVINLSVCQ